MPDAPADPILTTREVAAYLRRSAHTVRLWANAGLLPRCAPGKPYVFRQSDVLAFCAAQVEENKAKESFTHAAHL